VLAARRRPAADTTVRATTAPVVVRLADSSVLRLESGSVARYRPGIANRRLWLVGKAALSIAPGKPFTVWTETAVMHSAAATLDIRTEGLETTYVDVTAGSVRLRAQNEDNDPAYPAVTVSAGQSGVAAKMVGARLVRPKQ
jgi:ferric-dicitrate binding protein FerR (iron transport regulator)